MVFEAGFTVTGMEKVYAAEYSSIEDFEYSGDTITKYIGNDAFVKVPSGFKKIDNYAFQGCDSLLAVDIPEGVWVLGYGAFADCSNLDCVRIPQSMAIMWHGAFSGSWNISDIYYSGSADSWSNISIYEGTRPSGLDNATIHYGYSEIPEGVVESIYKKVKSVSLEGDQSAVVTANGDLYCWGSNYYGQVGNGTTQHQFTPVKILQDVEHISSRYFHNAAVTTKGDLYCWGLNDDGQVGNGTEENQTTPVKVLENVTTFSLNLNQSAAITTNGDLYYWGGGQLEPVIILENVKSVLLGDGQHNAAVTTNGDLYCWGRNSFGQVGNGTTENQSTPVKVLENVTSFSLNENQSAAVTTNGDLYCWGYNYSGQVGNGTTENQITPVKILENVRTFLLGDGQHNAAVTTSDDLYCWGKNWFGQVGNGTTENQTTPVKVLDNVISISIHRDQSAAVTTNGDLYCWGNNENGQIGNGTTENQITPVTVLQDVDYFILGNHRNAAVTINGDLYCWGNNENGQIGNGTTEEQTTPVKVLQNVEHISSGYHHNAAVTTNGDLYCWGHNSVGEVGNGTTEDQLTPVKINLSSNDINEDAESITTVTKIPGSKKNYYGANYYDNTAVGDVYDDAKEFVKAMDYYLSELQKATQKDAKTAKNTKKGSAEILKERDVSSDSKIITMESTLPDEALDSVYETLAQYLDMYVEEGKTLGKIDMSASTIDISASIVNKIRNNINWSQFQRTIGKYNVSFNVINLLGAYTGKVTVVRGNKTYYGVIVSSSKDTAKVLTEYINTMSEWEKDALYQALKSVFSELSSVTGISDFASSEIKSLLKDKVELLRNHGYGDLLKYCIKVRDGYDIVNTIVSAKDADGLTDVMNKAESIYKKIKDLDYSDAAVTNKTVTLAMNRLTNAKNQLEKDLFDYVYSGNTNNENWITKKWNSFKSLFIQCPVDVIIYDGEGNTLGQIIDTDYSYTEDIYIDVDDDVKTIIIPNELDVTIKFIGSDAGEMTYVIEQTENGKVVGRANYYNIPLNDGKQFLQELDAGSISDDFQGSVQSDNESFNPSEYLSVNNKNANVSIQCEATEGGTIIGTGVYPKGEPVVLSAYPDDGYCFKGWYIDEQLQNLSSVYRFAASQNVNLKAKFEKIRERESIYGVEISDAYKDTTDFIVYKNGDSTNDILICMAGNANIDNLSVKLKTNQTGDSTRAPVYDGVSRFLIKTVDIQNVDALEIYEAKRNELIGTIYYSNPENAGGDSTDNGNTGDCTGGSTDTGNTSGSTTGGTADSGNTGDSTGGLTDSVNTDKDTGDTSDNGNVDEDTGDSTDSGNADESTGNSPDTENGNETTNNTSTTDIVKGDKVKIGGSTYTVTNTKTKEVTYTKTTSKSSTIKIPATVKINGVTYKVTKIGDDAFKNNKKIVKVILGKNINEIGKRAFQGCTKLKSITITSKVKVIGRDAFSGDRKLTALRISSDKLTIKGVKNSLKGSYIKTIQLSGTAKKLYKNYVKYFKKSNCGKKVIIKK